MCSQSTRTGLRKVFKAPASLAQNAMRQAVWVYRRWRKEHSVKKPTIKRKCMVLTPKLSLNFGWDRASILTFEGRVNVDLMYIKNYHGKYKDWKLKEGRLVEKDGLWLKCIFEKTIHKAETEDVMGIDLNFNNITIADQHGIKKMDVGMFKKTIAHKKIMESIQKLHKDWRYTKSIFYAIKRHGKRMRDRVIDEARKIAKMIIKPNTAIALEDLRHIRASNNSFSKLHLWCYRKLQRAIANKNEEHGNPTIFVRARGTSSNCPSCNTKLVEIGYHTKLCPKCNKIRDRDEIASINIRMRGLQLALIAPEQMQAQEVMKGKLKC